MKTVGIIIKILLFVLIAYITYTIAETYSLLENEKESFYKEKLHQFDTSKISASENPIESSPETNENLENTHQIEDQIKDVENETIETAEDTTLDSDLNILDDAEYELALDILKNSSDLLETAKTLHDVRSFGDLQSVNDVALIQLNSSVGMPYNVRIALENVIKFNSETLSYFTENNYSGSTLDESILELNLSTINSANISISEYRGE